jgi:hypothetical protein
MHRDALPLPTRRGFLGAAVATTRLAEARATPGNSE